ncbi:MAG: Stp1/IreP family PP2C-type Ser/Thr phosphatase [Erysipelotrichaceae bacterium]|nr:Stp1/IreP family PP2C-type Ser/Thr phosphatase [Erysipelotrichaceae bacterium]
MRYYGLTDRGLTRPQNQDSFRIVQQDDTVLAIVCDGIGGHQAGDIASRMACDTMVRCFRRQYDKNPEIWYTHSLEKVNKVVYELAKSEPKYKGMGTTMVAALVDNSGKTFLLNIGDSRAYLIDKNWNISQLTEDHSLVNELIKRDGMSEDKAMEIGRHVITKAIGIWPVIEGDIYELDEDFNYLMLCSDGLHNYVEGNRIVEVLQDKETTGRQKCEKLVELANEAGGYDNITVILVEK